MDINQTKLKVESYKEILLQTILKNRENLDTNVITYAIKDFVKNYEIYSNEKKRLLDVISEIRK